MNGYDKSLFQNRHLRTVLITVTIWTAVAAAVGMLWLPVESSRRDNIAVTLALWGVAGIAVAIGARSRGKTSRIQTYGADACESDESLNEGVVQKWYRRRDEAGGERIQATLRADFAPCQQVATLHIPFCPPFAVAPEVTVAPLNADGVTVRVERCLPNGARIDVKRPASPDAASHCVAVTACSDSGSGNRSRIATAPVR